MTAASTKDRTKTIFRFFFKKADDTKPSLARMSRHKGNSKTTPKGRTKEMTKDRYDPRENIGCNESVAKPRKNFTPAGRTK